MKNLSGIIFAATMLATPACACTDWKAVAAFDAVIAANDKILVGLETSVQDDPQCVQLRAGKIEYGDPVKWPKGSPAYFVASELCGGASTRLISHASDVESHLKSALDDECK
jgi:hypothetical protein